MKDLSNEFVTYEIALKLKELGFDEKCLAWYLPEIYEKGNICSPILGAYFRNWNTFKDRLNCPLWQQVIDWFREKRNIDIWIERDLHDEYKRFYIQIPQITETPLNNHFNRWCDEFPKAREKAVLKTIELCKNMN